MEQLLSNLALGFSVALTVNNLMYCFIGCMPVSYTHLTLPTNREV